MISAVAIAQIESCKIRECTSHVSPAPGECAVDLVVDDITAAAQVQEALVRCSHLFDRGTPTIWSMDGHLPLRFSPEANIAGHFHAVN
jgi:hypothetical protein